MTEQLAEAYSTKRVTLSLEERDGKPGCRVAYQDGYVSWAPSQVIMRDYRGVTEGLTFGQALESLKLGKKVRRKYWTGANSKAFIMLIADSPFVVLPGGLGCGNAEVKPYIPAAAELMAEDWVEVA